LGIHFEKVHIAFPFGASGSEKSILPVHSIAESLAGMVSTFPAKQIVEQAKNPIKASNLIAKGIYVWYFHIFLTLCQLFPGQDSKILATIVFPIILTLDINL
jgi:hypothetical protein